MYDKEAGSVDMTACAEAYRAAKAARTHEYQKSERMGKAATLRGALLGARGLGDSSSQRSRSAQSLRRWAAALSMRAWGSDPATRSLALASHSVVAGMGALDAASVAKLYRRIETDAEKKEAARKALLLEQFQAGEGSDCERGQAGHSSARDLPDVGGTKSLW